MRIYIAGPMTGLPHKNYPAFHAEAAWLRAMGHEVVSPAEIWPLDAQGEWHDFMRKDLSALLTCDGIHLLKGWEKSDGATFELYVATKVCMAVSYQPNARQPVADVQEP
jgi:hypothetical protein